MLEHEPPPERRRGADRLAVRVALAYSLVGATWIVATDLLLGAIARERTPVWVETVRGLLFVLGSAGLVFAVIRRSRRRSDRADANVAQAQAALQRTEERYQRLVENVPAVTYINAVDPEDASRTTCVYISPQLTELLGYEPSEWIQDDRLWRRVIHSDDRERVLRINAECLPGDRFRADFRANTKDGRVVWIHDEAVYVPGGDRTPAYWQGVMVDVTAQRVQDEALHEFTESLSGVFKAAPLAIIVLEPDGTVRHWNPAAERMFGWTAKEVVGRRLPYVPPEKQEEFEQLMERELAGGSIAGFETTRMRKDGSRIDVSLSVASLVGRDGGVSGMLGVIEDITERRAAEAALARRTRQQQDALDRQLRLATRLELLHQVDRDVLSTTSIDDMAGRALEHLRHLVRFDRGSVGLIDPETGTFTYVAARHSPAMGPVPPARPHVPDAVARELLSRDVLLLRDLDDTNIDTPYVAMARELGIRSVLSIALLSEDGQLGVLVLSSLVADAFDDEAVDIAKEIGSELAIAIRQALLREAVAERAEQLARLAEERRQMLHRIVRAQEEERERVALELHDGLGQVLTSISLFTSDLADDVPPGAKPRAVRVNELVRRAIVDSRQLVWSLRPPELERLGLAPALRRLAEEVSVPELTVDLHEEIGDLRLEPEAEAVVYRVVQEAVHNAQKHACASAISILLHRQDAALSALVEDNGRGFDPAAVPTGRGLGLIGMRERAELVDGDLVVESAVDAGTRIRLEVPIGETGRG